MRHGLPRANFHSSAPSPSNIDSPSGVDSSPTKVGSREKTRSRDDGHPQGGLSNLGSSASADVPVSLDLFDPDSDLTPSVEFEGDSVPMVSQVVANARFFGVEDLPLAEIVDVSSEIVPGQWAIYRIGQDDPDRVIADAIARGATGILTEQLLPCPVPQCIVADAEAAAASIEHARLGRPDTRVLTIAVAGAAGKTTTALLISKLLRDQGLRAAYQCDLGSCDGVLQSTDAGAITGGRGLIHFLDLAADSGAQVAVIEINDAIAAAGGYQCVEFDLMVVCGNTRRPESFGAETLITLAERLAPDSVVVLPQQAALDTSDWDAGHASMVTYGFPEAAHSSTANVEVDIIDNSGGLMTMLLSHDDTMHVMESPLTGRQNAENIAAAATIGLLLDRPLHEIGESLGSLRSIPGRDQRFANFGVPTVILEAAGCPVRAKRSIENYRGQPGVKKVWTILAIDSAADDDLAGYGTLVERASHHVTLTSAGDSKASFLSGAHEVLDGVQHCGACRLVADPAAALQWVLSRASQDDVVMVLTGDRGISPEARRTDIADWERRIESAVGELTSPQPATKLGVFRPDDE